MKPSFSFFNRLLRALWGIVWVLFFRLSPRPFHKWRIFLLRLFGAKIGRNCAIHASAKIWLPSNLICEDTVAIATDVEIYNPSVITLKTHAIISQGAYLCGASHDYTKAVFPLYSKPITIGEYAWICARAVVMPGVEVGNYSIVGLGSVATKSTLPYGIYAGLPAKFIKKRVLDDE